MGDPNKTLERISRSASLPDYGSLMDTIKVLTDDQSEGNILLAKHIWSRATIVMPQYLRTNK